MSAAGGSPEKIVTDTLVIGAGVVGSAVAMGLARAANAPQVLTVDLDLGGEWSSSELNAGGVRATWSKEVNLVASKTTIEYFAQRADEVGYHASGYLWMHRPDRWEEALKAREMHVAHGWPVEVWDVAELRRRVPFIDKTDDLAGAIFGSRDGLVNPNRLKEHYREQAAAKGAKFLDGVWVESATHSPNGTRVRAFRFHGAGTVPSETKKRVLTEIAAGGAWTAELEALGAWIEIECKTVINCAGAWAPAVAQRLGYSSPSQPVRRQISLFHAREVNLTQYGMMIDPSGVYFHPEAIYGLAGFAIAEEPAGYNFHYDAESFFENYIWPSLYERSTQFESLRHVSGWAGLYENSPDHHAIIGRAPVAGAQVFEAHSFSGHGVMQSYAVGQAMAELILQGRYHSIDYSALSGDRFSRGGPQIAHETWVI